MSRAIVKTVREEFLYEYASLLSRCAAGKVGHKTITEHFQSLVDGQIELQAEDAGWQFGRETTYECAFCSSTMALVEDRLVPIRYGGDDSPKNTIWACRECKESRGTQGIFELLGLIQKDNLKPLLVQRYLKLLYDLHQKSKTLEIDSTNIARLCRRCRLPSLCVEWNKVGKLTCFCLESVF